jgi:hypothetical protein
VVVLGCTREKPSTRSALVICACARAWPRLVEVGLVDDHQVGQLHHALLDGLQVVAGVGQLQQHEHVGHAGHRGLALADADGLDDHHVVARRLADQHRLARLLGHAAERAAEDGLGRM